MANNPFSTPSSPWALPPSTLGTLFNTSARVTRLQSRWASPTGVFTALKGNWNSGSVAQANTGFGHALKYLAAGLGSEATAAYTGATGETFANETDQARLWSQSLPYVYAWCNGGLTSTQNATLISRIESNNATLETSIGSLGKFLIDGPGNGNVGMPGYIFGVIAIQGQAGATDRRTNLRNLVQNMANYLDEGHAEGAWFSYPHLFSYLVNCIIAYHIATGEENLLTTRCKAIANRGEFLCRALSSNGTSYYRMKPCNQRINSGGLIFTQFPDEAWSAAMQCDVTADPLMAYIRDQQWAHSTPTQWSHLQLASDPTWYGLLCDVSVVGVAPATQGVALNKAFPVSGVTEFRGGWNQGTDLVGQFYAGPSRSNDHDHPTPGHFQIRVGGTWLIKDGYNYAGSPSVWENAVPTTSGEVAGYSMCTSGPTFSPSATQATREDRDGSATVGTPSGSSTAYPLSNVTTNGVRQTRLSGSMGALTDDGTLAKVTGDLSKAFPQVTSAKRTVGFRKNGADKGTFVIYDQFVAPASVDHIRANFWSAVKPTFVSEAVLQGSSSAGVVQWTGDHVVIKNGSYQATIQCVTPFSKLHGVGGTGFESWFDGYPTNGANLDYLANDNNDARNTTSVGWLNGQWRTSFQTSQATAGGEMLFVVTVDALGTTAPSFTKAQALALLNPSNVGNLIMPGKTQFLQKKSLDYSDGHVDPGILTYYAALFTVAASDDGTGGTELSTTGYARQALSSSSFAAASGGSPASTSTAADLSWGPFPSGGGSSVVSLGLFDAASSGNLCWHDFLGTDDWKPFTCTLASPGLITCPGHGLSNGDLIAVTAKYGGALPATAGSWAAPLTVAGVSGDTFNVGVNTTGSGSGQLRKIVTISIANNDTLKLPAASGILTEA